MYITIQASYLVTAKNQILTPNSTLEVLEPSLLESFC